MKTQFMLSALTASLLAMQASAQSPANQQSLTTVIVNANRIAQPYSDVMKSVTVIDRETLIASAAPDMFSVLQAVPGLQLARTGLMGAQTSLFTRGAESDHTLVLLDGVRINTASEGAARLENIPLSQVERIEVTRGPQSSLYGADAIGGIIHIYTSQQTAPDSPALTGDISAGAGTEASRSAQANVTLTQSNTELDLSLSHNETDGIRPRNEPQSAQDKSPYENTAWSARLTQQLNGDSRLWASVLESDAEYTFDGGESENISRTVTGGARFELNNLFTSQVQVSRFKDDNLYQQFSPTESTTTRTSVQWQNELSWNENSESVLGLDTDREKLVYVASGAVQNEERRDNEAVFALHSQTFGANQLSLSLRYDDNEQFGDFTTGRLALGRDIGEQSNIWIAAGNAFKAPNLIDLYVDFPQFFFYANPALQPEESKNTELGISTVLANTSLQATIYNNRLSNLIDSNATFDSLTNISRAEISGVELTASRAIANWNAQASITLMDHENKATGESLLRRADEQANLRLRREFQQLSLLFDWLWVGERADLDPVTFARSRVDSYNKLDIVANWQFGEALNAQLRIGNALDEDYEVVDGYNTLGRNAMLKLRYQF